MGPEAITRVLDNMKKVIVGKPDALELTMVGLLCEGHILFEDVPGVGKTTLAKTLACSLGGIFHRVQCTPDLLPSDITGIYFFNQKKGEFEFRAGPVMSNILLVDEINRATPRTQSSLLECMEERQITVDGNTMPVPSPFLVIATLNPIELQGTFPLPEAQLDRFMLRLELGYPSKEEEDKMLLRFEHSSPLANLPQVATLEEISALKKVAQNVFIEPSIRSYMLDLIARTRKNDAISLGASPRASLALFKASQALALIKGRDYVIPDDVKALTIPVLSHRLVLNTEAYLHNQSKYKVLEDILTSVAVPVES